MNILLLLGLTRSKASLSLVHFIASQRPPSLLNLKWMLKEWIVIYGPVRPPKTNTAFTTMHKHKLLKLHTLGLNPSSATNYLCDLSWLLYLFWLYFFHSKVERTIVRTSRGCRNYNSSHAGKVLCPRPDRRFMIIIGASPPSWGEGWEVGIDVGWVGWTFWIKAILPLFLQPEC